MQEIAMYQVPALRAGLRQGPHPVSDRCWKGSQLLVASQGGAPSVYQFPRWPTRPAGRNSGQLPADVSAWCQTTGAPGSAGTRQRATSRR
jgi:hypothetical protein